MPSVKYVSIVILAAAYFLCGKLALLLAIPPGYATAVWPAAGVALAAILLRGYVLWPGVLLGSFFVNLNAPPDTSQSLLTLLSGFVVPIVIASGAALQAVTGAYLVRRYVGYPLCLDSVRDVLKFTLFACGFGCAVNASVGTVTLLLAGLLPAENFIFNWLTWWVGDGLGIMIFAVLMFVYFAEPREIWRTRSRILPLALVGASVLVVALYILGSRWELGRQQDEFSRYSSQIIHRAQSVIDTHIENLYAVKSLLEVSDKVTATEFEAFTKGFLERNKGFQAIAWTPRVSSANRSAFESLMSEERGRPVIITGRNNEQNLVPQHNKEDYVVIRYIEPMASNAKALGFDISSRDTVRSALANATIGNRPATTAPIHLVQDQQDQLGLVVYLPVVKVASVDTPALHGYVSGVFRVPDLMSVLLSTESLGDISASISIVGGGRLFEKNADSARQALFSDAAVLHFANAEWLLELTADQRFIVGSRSMVPWILLVSGLLFTGLLGMALLVLTGQKYESESARKRLNEMFLKLQEAQDHLIESEKMASLGGLVAGFAHELNTPLGIAITAESTLQNDIAKLNTLLLDSEAPTSATELLLRMRDASHIALTNVQRAGTLISSFKLVSVDQETVEARTINLHDYLADVFVHVAPSYRKSGHEVILECSPDITIRTVPGGLAQVVINLLNNSLIHAFADGQKGHVKLQVSRQSDEVVLRFSDDGKGIPVLDQKKIFEPFYTTRRGSGGTGLGLHVVYNIVRRQLRGRITVISEPDHGACFKITLPAVINECKEQGESVPVSV
jgi:signal transduction histidine kinase